MKKLIKRTENRLDSVKAFVGAKCNDCNNCSCSCTAAVAKGTLDDNARVIAKYNGNYANG